MTYRFETCQLKRCEEADKEASGGSHAPEKVQAQEEPSIHHGGALHCLSVMIRKKISNQVNLIKDKRNES